MLCIYIVYILYVHILDTQLNRNTLHKAKTTKQALLFPRWKHLNCVMLSEFSGRVSSELLSREPGEVIASDSRNINSKWCGSRKLWIKHNVSCLTILSLLIKPWACSPIMALTAVIEMATWLKIQLIMQPYGQKNAKTVDWPSRWNLFSAKKIYIKICLSF